MVVGEMSIACGLVCRFAMTRASHVRASSSSSGPSSKISVSASEIESLDLVDEKHFPPLANEYKRPLTTPSTTLKDGLDPPANDGWEGVLEKDVDFAVGLSCIK